MRSPLIILALLAAACCTPSAPTETPPASPQASAPEAEAYDYLAPRPPAMMSATAEEIAEGEHLVRIACISCHAIEPDAASPHPEAPPLSRLSEEYPVLLLEEAFANGILVGHPNMPEFKFTPADVRAILGYLESIQVNRGI